MKEIKGKWALSTSSCMLVKVSYCHYFVLFSSQNCWILFFPFLGPVLVILEVSSAQTLNNPFVLESLLFNLFWTLWIVLHSDYFISLVVNLVTTALAWESVFKAPCRQFTSPLGLWFSRFPKLGQSYELTVKNTSVRPFSRKIWLVILERMLITWLSRTITKFRES